MSAPPAPAEPRRCPRTGRTRASALPPGSLRPSDMLVAYFACGVAFLVAAGVAAGADAVAGVEDGRWLALHLAFVGGVSQLVLGAAQFFAGAFLATDPPRRRMIRAQLALWNAGVVAVAIGVPGDATVLTGIGGALLLAALALFAIALRAMERRSLQRARWAVRWYYAAAAFLAVGAALGPVLDAGAGWPHGSLLAAHLTVNLGGWFGTAIVGTLHTFYPSLTQTALERPELQGPTFATWTAGIAAVAVAAAFDLPALAVAGWGLLAVAAALLAVNLIASARRASAHTRPAALVGGAQALLVIAALAGLTITIDGGATSAQLGQHRDVPAVLAGAGWIGLTVAGSLVHLLTLMARVRNLARPAPPAGTRGSSALAVASLAVVLAAAAARLSGDETAITVTGALLAALFAGLGAAVIAAAVRAVRAAPLRI